MGDGECGDIVAMCLKISFSYNTCIILYYQYFYIHVSCKGIFDIHIVNISRQFITTNDCFNYRNAGSLFCHLNSLHLPSMLV